MHTQLFCCFTDDNVFEYDLFLSKCIERERVCWETTRNGESNWDELLKKKK